MKKTGIKSTQPDAIPVNAMFEDAINEIEDLIVDFVEQGGEDYMTANHFLFKHPEVKTFGQAKAWFRERLK